MGLGFCWDYGVSGKENERRDGIFRFQEPSQTSVRIVQSKLDHEVCYPYPLVNKIENR